ncbi:ABC transporter permease [Pseudomonas mangrovi]|uniref:Arginine ABC transporter permease protein ArtM n=1 Tax=Pseudomonas mangrovi TaxID=2161748 RepID=A0A2T5PA49_9PSED|nr:ABC transporter permease [Pseudomonas mangrovi]PTU74599.1 ABC transporter permease [Pseudomonas mangrovi]
MRWDAVYKSLPRLFEGALLTLELVGISVVVGLILALPLGIARASGNIWIGALPYVYIFFFRGTPLLVQLFLLYYGLSQFDSVRESAIWAGSHVQTTLDLGFHRWALDFTIPGLREPFVCAVVTMTLHTAAYIAEIIRGAIRAVPQGEIEAARALGMSYAQSMRHIILPRAARIGLPAYSNEVILMLKASALASTITLMELTGMAQTIISRNYLSTEIYFAAGLFYLLISFVLVQAFRLLERWLRVDALQGR